MDIISYIANCKKEESGDHILPNNEKYDHEKFMKIWRSKVLRNIIMEFVREYNIKYFNQLKKSNKILYRKNKIRNALRKHNIEYRLDSINIKDYVICQCDLKLKHVVYKMCCYKFWFEYCNAPHGKFNFAKLLQRYPVPSVWPWL